MYTVWKSRKNRLGGLDVAVYWQIIMNAAGMVGTFAVCTWTGWKGVLNGYNAENLITLKMRIHAKWVNGEYKDKMNFLFFHSFFVRLLRRLPLKQGIDRKLSMWQTPIRLWIQKGWKLYIFLLAVSISTATRSITNRPAGQPANRLFVLSWITPSNHSSFIFNKIL